MNARTRSAIKITGIVIATVVGIGVPLGNPIGLLALVSGLFAVAAFLGFRVLPLRVPDRTIASLESREAELRKQYFISSSAMNNMSQGLCMFDAQKRLVICNKRFAELYRLPADLTEPGTPLIDILEYRIRTGSSAATPEEFIRDRLAVVAGRERRIEVIEQNDGRAIEILYDPLPEGGWVTTHEDVTDRQAREKILVEAQAKAERSERESRAAHARLREAIEMLPEGIVFMDRENRLVLWNRRYAELFKEIADILAPGVSYEHILRVSLARSPAEEIDDPEAWLAFRLAQHANPQGPHEQRFRDGRWIRYEERRTADGGSIGVRIDITDLKKREESFRLLFDANPVPMWLYDPESLRFLAVNDAAIAHYGYSRERFLEMRAHDVHPAEERHIAEQTIRGLTAADDGDHVWRHLTAAGDRIQVLNFVRELSYAGRLAKLAAVIDVTERRAAEERLGHMARHDALTNLPNRVLFREKLEAAMACVQRGGGFAVHCLDLDRFKDVNDTLGHPIGDLLLMQVAGRLCEAVREEDVVARLGGDEFAIIQCDVDGPDRASLLAARLVERIGEPYEIDGRELVIGTSVGVALAPGDGADPDELLKNADLALYRAKVDGRGTLRFFERQMDARLQARRLFESELRSALVNSELELHYQPLFDLEANAITGFEALLRWRHPTRGTVAPAEFIPVAEDTGLIVPIGEWVLRQACAEAAKWPAEIKVAVNLSPVQFKSRQLVAAVVSALASAGLAAERLELEVTESVLLQESEGTLATLHKLRGLGIRIAMDDFGTGHSSLSYLRSFPFDRIKIDRSFVRDLVKQDCAAIVHATTELARKLGIATTAEGVETAEQLALLRAEGCTEIQGHLISPPQPAAGVAALLARYGPRRATTAARDGRRGKPQLKLA